MTSIDEIEHLIEPFLLTPITFTIDEKVIKQGKLQLFCIKDFFCVFTLLSLEKNNKKTVYEIPYPFNIKTLNDGRLELDYTLESFYLSNSRVRELVNKLKLSKTSKFFNKKIVVTAVKLSIIE